MANISTRFICVHYDEEWEATVVGVCQRILELGGTILAIVPDPQEQNWISIFWIEPLDRELTDEEDDSIRLLA